MWELSVHNMSLQFDHTHCLDNQNWKRVCILRVIKPKSKKKESFFLFPHPPTMHFSLSTNSLTFDTSITPTSAHSILSRHVLVFLDSWDSSDSFLLWEPLLRMVLGLHRIPFGDLHVALQIGTMLSPVGGQIRVQSFRWTYERAALPYSFPSC